MRFELANPRMFPHLMRLIYGTGIHGAYVVDKIKFNLWLANYSTAVSTTVYDQVNLAVKTCSCCGCTPYSALVGEGEYNCQAQLLPLREENGFKTHSQPKRAFLRTRASSRTFLFSSF